MGKYLPIYNLIIFIILFTACKNQENKQEVDIIQVPESFEKLDEIENDLGKDEKIQIPKSFKVLNETEGDLNKDGVSEKVIVYDTEKETDFGTERQIYIYKKNDNKWVL